MVSPHSQSGKDHDQDHDSCQQAVEGDHGQEPEPGASDSADSHDRPDIQIIAGEKEDHKAEYSVNNALHPCLKARFDTLGSVAEAEGQKEAVDK